MIAYDNKAWYLHIFVWKGSVIKGILPRVIIFMAWAALMIYLYDVDIIPGERKIDMVIYNVVGLALGLLLVFRTNTSYDRYWEGRKLLGGMANSCRNVALMLDNIIPYEDKEKRKDFAELIAAFNYAYKEHLRDGVKREDIPVLRDEYRDIVFKSKHVPLAIMKLLQKKASELQAINPANTIFIGLNKEMAAFVDNLGGMERIRNTPVPFAYPAHLQLFIMIYFLGLPFGLYEKFHWLSVPAVGAIALILLGINEIGVEIEDPFGDDPNDLPVDKICENIEKNVNQILLED
ncbi:MAG: bestrophin family protein [Bacteroidota bacterium]